MTGGLPFHPAVVHVPIGVGLVVPVLAAVVTAALWRGHATRAAWSLVALLQAIVFAGALVALRTGEAEEERLESRVSKDAVERHEEQAEVLAWLSGVSLAAGVAVLLVRGSAAVVATALAATVASSAVAGAALWVGHSGGEIVYGRDAALALRGETPGSAGEAGSRRFSDP
jgi:uncharacterized membrane protein